MASVEKLQEIIDEADQILDRAVLITGDAPFYMQADDEYAKLEIDGNKATLSWPEHTSDYYGGGYLERQSVTFPSELLLMSTDEIGVWKAEELRKHCAKMEAENETAMRLHAERQTALELQTLAALQQKYGPKT